MKRKHEENTANKNTPAKIIHKIKETVKGITKRHQLYTLLLNLSAHGYVLHAIFLPSYVIYAKRSNIYQTRLKRATFGFQSDSPLFKLLQLILKKYAFSIEKTLVSFEIQLRHSRCK